jgi:CBS domain-containing protein
MQLVRDVMTPKPVSVPEGATLPQVATIMRDHDIGDVLVRSETAGMLGILTDRDIVIRGLTGGAGAEALTAGEICSRDVTAVAADDSVLTAFDLMRERAIRRLPVTDGDEVVGILSLGDLALERDPESVLADISEAAPDS